MITSALSPLNIINPKPMPWDWNPAATFVEAYNAQRITNQKAEEMRLKNELEQILFPAKVAKAEYEMKKLGYDSQLLEKIYRTEAAALDNAYRGINSAVGGGGGGGGGSNASVGNQNAPRRAAVDWNAWGNPSAQQTSDDLIP